MKEQRSATAPDTMVAAAAAKAAGRRWRGGGAQPSSRLEQGAGGTQFFRLREAEAAWRVASTPLPTPKCGHGSLDFAAAGGVVPACHTPTKLPRSPHWNMKECQVLDSWEASEVPTRAKSQSPMLQGGEGEGEGHVVGKAATSTWAGVMSGGVRGHQGQWQHGMLHVALRSSPTLVQCTPNPTHLQRVAGLAFHAVGKAIPACNVALMRDHCCATGM